MFTLIKKTTMTFFISFILLSAGCGSTEEEGTFSASLQEGPGGEHGVLGKGVFEALRKLDLRPDQRATLEALVKDLRDKMTPVRNVRAEMAQEMARGIRLGSIDKSRFVPLQKKLEGTATEVRPVVIAALNRLHQTLDAAQRSKLVKAIEPRHHGRGMKHHFLKKLQDELKLSEDQRDKIKEAVRGTMKNDRSELRARFMQMHQNLKVAAEAFTSDTFDAGKLTILSDAPARVRQGTDRMLDMVQTVLPILTSEQRGIAASLLEKKAKRMQESADLY